MTSQLQLIDKTPSIPTEKHSIIMIERFKEKYHMYCITGVIPTYFIWACSARGPEPLPFHILKFGKWGPFHITFPEKVPLSHTSSLKKRPLFLSLNPKKIPGASPY